MNIAVLIIRVEKIHANVKNEMLWRRMFNMRQRWHGDPLK